ncbi:MAG: hypothetical protein ABIE23_02110 [archaeon]|nr:hypothetical protein [Candidatus Micrarchaeota archaeon]
MNFNVKKIGLLFLIAGILFLIGCSQPQKEIPEARIDSLEIKGDVLECSIWSSMEVEDAKFELLNEEGESLCIKYLDLGKGDNKKELKCEFSDKLSFSVTPPEGEKKTKEFEFNIPLIEFKKGKAFFYELEPGPLSESKEKILIDAYITRESDGEWEGIEVINGFPGEEKIGFIKFRISRDVLRIGATEVLGKEDVMKEDTKFSPSNEVASGEFLLPFTLMVYGGIGLDVEKLIKEKKGSFTGEADTRVEFELERTIVKNGWLSHKISIASTETGGGILLFTSTEAPYILIELVTQGTPIMQLKSVEEKEFSLD